MKTYIYRGRGSHFISTFIGTWRKRFRDYVNQCLTSGFIPYTFRPLQFLAKYVAMLWVFIQVGRIHVAGKEHLAVAERVIFYANHSSMFDVPIIFSIMKRYPRYMTAVEEMHGLWGLKAIAMGACGSFAVDRSHGKTVLEPAINILLQGDPLMVFPEGKISTTGQYRPFKFGLFLIAHGASEKLEHKEKVGFVPIHICYHVRDVDTALGPYGAMGFKWRKGATVTVGAPIWINDFDSPVPDKVVFTLRQAIVEQPCPTAFELCEPQCG